ncbi:MAG: PspC domain-containing protein [Butyrivibrio sp.]|nr:PspC domain-containing protein [Butyrivibrio sp.]
MNTKRLYKSNDRRIAGVCGGLGEYLNVDPTLIRLIWILVVFAGGSGVLLYIIASIVMEDAPDYEQNSSNRDSYSTGYTNNYTANSSNDNETQDENREVVGFKYEDK